MSKEGDDSKAVNEAKLMAITGKIRELQMELARVLGVPNNSPQLGQAGGQEISRVGDGNVSDGGFA